MRTGLTPIAELRSTIEAMGTAARLPDIDIFAARDGAFHRALFAAVDTEDFRSLIVARSGHIDRLRKLILPDPGKIDRIIRSRHQIVAGLTESGADRTARSISHHLGETLSEVDRIVAAHPHYVR